MKEYFRYFKIPFLILAALLVITTAVTISRLSSRKERTNTECTTEERVFDYADKLTDKEENRLRALIDKMQKKSGCDIVIVTLDESLAEYAAQYEDIIGPVPVEEYVMVYADNFYDEHKFGYDEPFDDGDGVLLLDNWYREEDGGVYSWMSTSGEAYWTYSSSMIDRILDESLMDVETDPYGAYSKFVKKFANTMSRGTDEEELPTTAFFPIAAMAALLFYFMNRVGNKGKKTTNTYTYVPKNSNVMKNKQDIFLRKTVSKHHIEPSTTTSSGSHYSSGGGGGHHVSSGGHTHGGGGHRR